MGEAGEFTSIPTLDYELLSTNRKEEFIASLRNAVVNIGFLYLKNPPVDKAIISALIEYIPWLFDLPQEKKDKIAMANSEHFLGYSRLGKELTKGAVDQREQFDFANKWDGKGWTPGDPEYLRLFGEAQVCSMYNLSPEYSNSLYALSGQRNVIYPDSEMLWNAIYPKLRS